jgi:hypothetical protein
MNINSSTEDTEFLIRHSMLKGYQALSLLTPPLYTVITLYRRGHQGFVVNRMLRATWIAGGVGTTVGGGLAWGKLRSQTPESLQDRRVRLMYNVRCVQLVCRSTHATALENTQIHTDDHSTIGSILFAVLTPALLWRRAHIINRVFCLSPCLISC